MRIVITGSEGFIGKELKEHCRTKNIEFIGIDAVAAEEDHHLVMDIRAPEIKGAIPQDVDALIHLAAISRDQDCRANPRLTFDINVLGTLNLIQAARGRGVRQFIFASSEWVYGQVGNNAVQTEDQPIDVTRVQSGYALSKIVGEQNLRMAHQQGFCPVTILRFGIVYGPRPGDWSAVESLFHAVRTQDTVSVGSLATARRFVHVSDIADGILSALGRKGFEIFNLAGDALITLREVIEQSASLLNRHPKVIEESPLSVSIRNPDNIKARRVLKWKPGIGLKEGLSTLMMPSLIKRE